MDWEETFSVPVSYSGSLADVNQTLSLEKQKSKHLFFFFFFFVKLFTVRFSTELSAPPIIIIQFVIFFAVVSSFTISQGALNVGEKTCPRTAHQGSVFQYQYSVSSKPAYNQCVELGHSRVVSTCMRHFQPASSWTCLNNMSEWLGLGITHSCIDRFLLFFCRNEWYWHAV